MTARERRNVQEQNREALSSIQQIARSFRTDPKGHQWLVDTLTTHSQSPKHGILVRLHQVPDQLGDVCEGMWLTDDRQFFRFSVLLPRARGEKMVIEDWRNVTEEVEINAHKPGTGKTFGYLAFEAQDALSAS